MRRQRNRGGDSGFLVLLLGGGAALAWYLYSQKQTVTTGTTANPITVAGQSTIPLNDSTGPTLPQGPGADASAQLIYGPSLETLLSQGAL